MLPPRATLPTCPSPGVRGLRSSSTTMTSAIGDTRGRPPEEPPVGLSLLTAERPLKPPSDDPIESMIIRFGHDLEVALLHRHREQGGRGGDGEQGRQVPAVGLGLEGLDHRAAHGVAGDEHRVGALPLDGVPHVVGVEPGHQDDGVALRELAQQAPLGGAVHQRRRHQEHDPAAGRALPGQFVGRLDPVAGGGVDALPEGHEDVLLPPHHALGHAGGAARVEDVEVVGGTLVEGRGASAPRPARPRTRGRSAGGSGAWAAHPRWRRGARCRRARRRRPPGRRCRRCSAARRPRSGS